MTRNDDHDPDTDQCIDPGMHPFPSPKASSSDLLARQVLERLDAELSETDEQGRPIFFGKVGLVAVVGNEDGAHKVIADLGQGLSDVGFTLAAQGSTYWVGQAMHTTDYQDLQQTPEVTANATGIAIRNAAHLARLLKASPYPAC